MRYLIALFTFTLLVSHLRSAELVDFGEDREIDFPAGFQVLGPDGKILKSFPDGRTATARGYKLKNGVKWYVSDYSWEQIQKGKLPNYMVAMGELPGASETNRVKPRELKEFKETKTIRFREGYEVRDLRGNVIKTVPGYQRVQAKGAYSTDSYREKWYVSDYSWEQMQKGKDPYVMVSLRAGDQGVVDYHDLGSLLQFWEFPDWDSFRVAFDEEIALLEQGGIIHDDPPTMADDVAYRWWDAIASGAIPREDAIECLRRLEKNKRQIDSRRDLPGICHLLIGDAREVETSILTEEDEASGQDQLVPFDDWIEEASSDLEETGLFFSSKSLMLLGLARLNQGDLESAAHAFDARKNVILKRLRAPEGSLPTNQGDNTEPNAIGYALYTASLLKRSLSNDEVDAWIDAHLRRTVAERLGVSAIGGENNFNVEDYSLFDYRGLLAVMHSSEQSARILLSAKGTSQQFQLLSGTPGIDLGFDDDVAWEINPLEVLKRFGITPWTDESYRLIDEGDLCFDYLRIRHFNPLLPHGNSYFCLAYDRTGVRKVWRVEEDLDAIEARIRGLVDLASTKRAQTSATDFEATYAAECAWFLETFIRPGLENSGEIRRLLICPDGPLNFVPFGALMDQDGRLLLEKYVVTRMPTVRMLVDPGLKANNESAGAMQALVLGNPAFDDSAPLSAMKKHEDGTRLVSRATLRFRDLPGTAREATKLESLLNEKSWQTQVLAASRASEPNLARLCAGPDLLHLASHAYYLPALEKGKQAFGGVVLGGDYSSGIALAGANVTMGEWLQGRQPQSDQDGILSAEEMARLNLDGCRLVVMSACETAQGRTLDGEGVQGLTLAAAVAGARNQLSTLWPVDDAATVEVMESFYTAFLGGHSPEEALVEAQRKHFAEWREEKGLPVALRWAAPFVCTTTEPFKAAGALLVDQARERVFATKLRSGEDGWVTTVNRAAKIWVTGFQPGTVYLWSKGYSEASEADEAGFASGEGTLLRHRDGKVTHRYEGTMREGRFVGEGRVSDRTGADKEGREETWPDGRAVR